MTIEEVLQKVNDYCGEKSYTEATLPESFRTKFAEHFVKANAEGDINDETLLGNMKFALNTAFSSASVLATVKAQEFTTKESELNKQIEELKAKLGQTPQPQPVPPAIPKEIQDKLDRLESYEKEGRKKEKIEEVLKLAKKNVRTDLHASFEKFASDYTVDVDEDSEAQAKKMTERFQEIFMDTIGDIKPLAPRVSRQRDEETIASIPKVTI